MVSMGRNDSNISVTTWHPPDQVGPLDWNSSLSVPSYQKICNPGSISDAIRSPTIPFKYVSPRFSIVILHVPSWCTDVFTQINLVIDKAQEDHSRLTPRWAFNIRFLQKMTTQSQSRPTLALERPLEYIFKHILPSNMDVANMDVALLNRWLWSLGQTFPNWTSTLNPTLHL